MNIHVRRVANASIVVIGVIIDRIKRRNLPKDTAIAMMRVARPYELLLYTTPKSEDSNARRAAASRCACYGQQNTLSSESDHPVPKWKVNPENISGV